MVSTGMLYWEKLGQTRWGSDDCSLDQGMGGHGENRVREHLGKYTLQSLSMISCGKRGQDPDHQFSVWLQQGWYAREGKIITWRSAPASFSIKNEIDRQLHLSYEHSNSLPQLEWLQSLASEWWLQPNWRGVFSCTERKKVDWKLWSRFPTWGSHSLKGEWWIWRAQNCEHLQPHHGPW